MELHFSLLWKGKPPKYIKSLNRKRKAHHWSKEFDCCVLATLYIWSNASEVTGEREGRIHPFARGPVSTSCHSFYLTDIALSLQEEILCQR